MRKPNLKILTIVASLAASQILSASLAEPAHKSTGPIIVDGMGKFIGRVIGTGASSIGADDSVSIRVVREFGNTPLIIELGTQGFITKQNSGIIAWFTNTKCTGQPYISADMPNIGTLYPYPRIHHRYASSNNIAFFEQAMVVYAEQPYTVQTIFTYGMLDIASPTHVSYCYSSATNPWKVSRMSVGKLAITGVGQFAPPFRMILDNGRGD